ncbi:SRPBCC family protein [Terracoccus luteus]|uniref:Carbon monoxide dehydrogenase subunit G n=1 Tax=Terracoccus luteus TaxID=53356 RepID=A0A839Q2S3_9MICO|nr:SRPBCC family protein [Terracoccus luteus]MBB2987412.1 carbon monoxide dehydrogenase subunit G [Terracoccus luteus]MCP2173063.1 carbon monoxide dehydrogenase subunit G [Terracoccus luteus]
MDLTHSFTVPTSVDEAWSLFMDLEKVGSCFPGATVTEVRDDGFSGTVKVKLGPIAMLYSGSGSFVERDDDAKMAVIEAKGKDKRGNGTAGATVTIQLSPDGSGARADVVTDLAVTGKPAQFGRGVMQDVSDKLLQAFVACVEKQLGGGEASGGGVTSTSPDAGQPAPAPTGPAPSAGEPASVMEEESEFVEAASDALASDTASTAAPAAPKAVPTVGRVAALADDDDGALDLGSAVIPVLARRYAPLAGAAVAGILVGWLAGRRR